MSGEFQKVESKQVFMFTGVYVYRCLCLQVFMFTKQVFMFIICLVSVEVILSEMLYLSHVDQKGTGESLSFL